MDLDDNLIARFASLFGEIEAFRPTYEAIWQRRDEELARRTGIKTHWTLRTDEEAARLGAAMRVLDQETGFSAANEKMEALWARLDPVVKMITKTPARDLAGLALKARATATAWEKLWREMPDDLDHEHELIRDLIENVCAVAGIDLAVSQRLAPRTDLN